MGGGAPGADWGGATLGWGQQRGGGGQQGGGGVNSEGVFNL